MFGNTKRCLIFSTSHILVSGAKHDPEINEDPSCTPSDAEQNGRYLMSKYSNNGKKHNHEILSPCTKVTIQKIKNWK